MREEFNRIKSPEILDQISDLLHERTGSYGKPTTEDPKILVKRFDRERDLLIRQLDEKDEIIWDLRNKQAQSESTKDNSNHEEQFLRMRAEWNGMLFKLQNIEKQLHEKQEIEQKLLEEKKKFESQLNELDSQNSHQAEERQQLISRLRQLLWDYQQLDSRFNKANSSHEEEKEVLNSKIQELEQYKNGLEFELQSLRQRYALTEQALNGCKKVLDSSSLKDYSQIKDLISEYSRLEENSFSDNTPGQKQPSKLSSPKPKKKAENVVSNDEASFSDHEVDSELPDLRFESSSSKASESNSVDSIDHNAENTKDASILESVGNNNHSIHTEQEPNEASDHRNNLIPSSRTKYLTKRLCDLERHFSKKQRDLLDEAEKERESIWKELVDGGIEYQKEQVEYLSNQESECIHDVKPLDYLQKEPENDGSDIGDNEPSFSTEFSKHQYTNQPAIPSSPFEMKLSSELALAEKKRLKYEGILQKRRMGDKVGKLLKTVNRVHKSSQGYEESPAEQQSSYFADFTVVTEPDTSMVLSYKPKGAEKRLTGMLNTNKIIPENEKEYADVNDDLNAALELLKKWKAQNEALKKELDGWTKVEREFEEKLGSGPAPRDDILDEASSTSSFKF